jgi:PHD/YefM family antitoxin component YafN of YafNO toxin-antitoxin module
MRKFSTVELDQNLGSVKAAAALAPVVITEHRKEKFVLMTADAFKALRAKADPRRAYGRGETPVRIAKMFESEIARRLDGKKA